MGIFNLLIFFAKRVIQASCNSNERKKFFRLLSDKKRLHATLWCIYHSISFDKFANRISKSEWLNAVKFRSDVRMEYKSKVKGMPISGGIPGSVGGGGVDPAKIYFLTKILNPDVVIETGVSSGVSSRAFLKAISDNGHGKLHSSDLRVLLPEGKTGFMVPKELKNNWFLYNEGDQLNLPNILKQIDKVDLFHYDSLKSQEKIEEVLKILRPYFHNESVIIIDDIDRHFFFKDTDFPGTKKLIFNNIGIYLPIKFY